MVGLDEDVPVRFPVAKELGATHCVNGSKEDVVKEMYRNLWKRQSWTCC